MTWIVGTMQKHLGERLNAHRDKAAPAVRWIRDREEGRGLMCNVFAAWAAVRGSHNMAAPHLSREEWNAWRATETSQQRNERRLQEAVARLQAYGQNVIAMFLSRMRKQKRTLRLKLAVLRKARATVGWRKVHNQVSRIVWRVRTAQAHARRGGRLDTRMATVVSEMKQQARTRGVAPVRDRAEGRPARMQLTRAAAIGPVLADMFLAAEPLGVG